MNKEREMKILVVIALIVSIVAIGIGFAAFSTTLTINGSAAINTDGKTWNVHFGNVTRSDTSTPGIGITLPTVTSGTSTTGNTNNIVINSFQVTFTDVNQKVEYIIPVKNEGSYNAIVTKYVAGGTPTCGTAGTDCTNVLKHLHYSVTWADTGNEPTNGDTLAAEATKNLKLVISYWPTTDASQDPTELPTTNVTVTFSATELTYGQN